MTIKKNFVRVSVVRKVGKDFEPVGDFLHTSKSVEKACTEYRKKPEFSGCLVYGEKVNLTFDLDIEKAIESGCAVLKAESEPTDEHDESEQ